MDYRFVPATGGPTRHGAPEFDHLGAKQRDERQRLWLHPHVVQGDRAAGRAEPFGGGRRTGEIGGQGPLGELDDDLDV
jgi:hypothetical protein